MVSKLDKMSESNYTIIDLESLSGIKAHTIRIWEKRYHILKPLRTDTNIRYYSNEDLKLLLNISFLNKNNVKISKIAQLHPDEIAEKVIGLHSISNSNSDLIDNLIIAMIDLNEALFDKIFAASLLRLNFETTISDVIFPFLNKTGLMWQTGAINPAQEHFISNLIRQKIILGIESIPKNHQTDALKAILFLPENELHENSLLLYHYVLKAKGYQTYYFGQTLPIADLNRIIDIANINIIVSVITCDMPQNKLTNFYQQLEKLPSNITIALSGRVMAENQHKLSSRFTFFKDTEALKNLISTIIK